MNQGKIAITAMLTVGAVLAGFGWWVRYTNSQQVLSVLGSAAVVAIRTGKTTELISVAQAESMDADVNEMPNVISVQPMGMQPVLVIPGDTKDISNAQGLIHARHHLVHAKGYHWDRPREEGCVPKWEVAVRFTGENGTATILLDFVCNRAYLVERRTEIGMRPILADALNSFLADLRP